MIRTPPQRPLDPVVRFINASGLAIPAGGQLYAGDPAAAGQPFQVTRPTRTAMLAIIIAGDAFAAAANTPGWGYMEGQPATLLDADDWDAVDDTVPLRSRIGSVMDSFEARLCVNGPQLILAKLEKPFVTAAFLRRRGGSIFVSNSDLSLAQSFEHKHFTEDWVLADGGPGKVIISRRAP